MALTYGPATYGAQPPAAPVLVAFQGPASQNRLTVLVRLILVLPALIVVGFVGIAAFVVAIIGWFGALFTGRLPAFAADFLTGYVRWQTRVIAYAFLLTDKYPPFTLENDDAYPVWLTAQPGRLNPAAVFFRIILVVPAVIVQTIVQSGTYPVLFVAWLIVLVSGQMPPSLFQALSAAVRYQTRVNGYFLMITSEWPWGLFGDTATPYFGSSPPAYGAYGVPGSYGAPPAPGTYGAPPAPGAYGAPPAPGAYGAPPPPVGTYGAPPPPAGTYSAPPPPVGAYGAPPPATTAPFGSAPHSPAAPAPPSLPGVAFTFGGPSYLWGYIDDRSYCGIWSATDLTAQPQMWPIGDQGEGWTRFRELEPDAVALADPTPPTAAPLAQGGMPSFGAAPHFAAGSPYPASSSPADDPRWRIVLSKGAKQLMVLFLVLGVVDYGVQQALIGSRTHVLQGVVANVEVQGAYQTLKSSVTTFQTQTAACQGSLSCVTAADQTVAQAFGSFVQQMREISVPTSATAAAATLITEGTHTQQIFEQLAGSTSAAQYQQNVASSNIT